MDISQKELAVAIKTLIKWSSLSDNAWALIRFAFPIN